MQFESRRKRAFILSLFLGLVPDVVIALVVAAIFASGAVGFAVVFVGLQVLYVLIWAKNSLWNWAFYALGGRKQTAAFLLDYLTARGFPEPKEHHSSADAYFNEIASEETAEIQLRIAAAAEGAALRYPMAQGRIQEGVRLSMAYEDALIAYKRSFQHAAR